ncbi:MAG: hypothetical protein HC880_21540 [Bacteroidia bacterium]|nr:hypothetical protein [Bacteroidia bacterium]
MTACRSAFAHTVFLIMVLSGSGYFQLLTAQVSHGGTPLSFGSHFRSLKLTDQWVSTEKVASAESIQTLIEQSQEVADNLFAAAIPVNFNLYNSGKWVSLWNGDRLWRLKVQSEGALSLRVLFDSLWIPPGGRLYLYDESGQQVLGAFTYQNNTPGRRFGTDMINHHTVIVEYYEPQSVLGQGVLSIFRVDHGFKPFTLDENPDPEPHLKNGQETLRFGNSSSCNVNVSCVGETWSQQRRGIVNIVLTSANGSGWCTGTLINNTARDRTPYILSAQHCEDDDGGQSFVDTWVFLFNYESGTCENPEAEPSRAQSVSGATIVASYDSSDFLLLKLENTIPPVL